MANLSLEFITLGAGPVPAPGEIVTVHYSGWLTDGTPFDSSRERDEPFQVAAGVGQVIAGWDAILLRLRVGDKVRAVIPPAMAYGEAGVGGVIPGHATLVFEIELLAIQ